MAGLAPTPEALLRNLAYLQLDLVDDVLREHLVENARATRREIEALLEAAAAAGELRRNVDVRSLARTVEVVIGGSLMSWATYREGRAVDSIARDLEAVLAPWLRNRRTREAAGSGRTRRTSEGTSACSPRLTLLRSLGSRVHGFTGSRRSGFFHSTFEALNP